MTEGASAGRRRRLSRGRTTTGTRRWRSKRSAPSRCSTGTRTASPARRRRGRPARAASPTATIFAQARSPGSRRRCRQSRTFAADGGHVLGICNGFQVLCEAGLLPGALRPNESLSFVCEDVPLRVERAGVAFLTRCEAGQRLTIPIKHGEGCYFADDELLAELDEAGQIVLRYEENPNGSVDSIAGVVNASGNVMGLMPHPEHAVDPLIGSGSTDGALILEALVDRARERLFAAA